MRPLPLNAMRRFRQLKRSKTAENSMRGPPRQKPEMEIWRKPHQ